MSCGGGKNYKASDRKSPRICKSLLYVEEKEQHNIEHENGNIHIAIAEAEGERAKNERVELSQNPFAFSREFNMHYTHIYELAES